MCFSLFFPTHNVIDAVLKLNMWFHYPQLQEKLFIHLLQLILCYLLMPGPSFFFLLVLPPTLFPSVTVFSMKKKKKYLIQLENLCFPPLDSQPFTHHLFLLVCSVLIPHNLVYNVINIGSVLLIHS